MAPGIWDILTGYRPPQDSNAIKPYQDPNMIGAAPVVDPEDRPMMDLAAERAAKMPPMPDPNLIGSTRTPAMGPPMGPRIASLQTDNNLLASLGPPPVSSVPQVRAEDRGDTIDLGSDPLLKSVVGPKTPDPSLQNRVSAKLQSKQLDGSVGQSHPSLSMLGQLLDQQLDPARDPASVQKKPADPYGDELNDAALLKAQKHGHMMDFVGNMIDAGVGVGNAISGKKADPGDKDYIKAIKAMGQNSVNSIKERRAGVDAATKREETLRANADRAEMDDPDSGISQAYRDFLVKLGYGDMTKNNPSATNLEKMIPVAERAKAHQLAMRTAEAAQAATAASREESMNLRRDALRQSQEHFDETKQKQLKDDLANSSSVMSQMDAFENKFGKYGVNLDNYNEKNLKDLPGFNVWGTGHWSAHNADARAMDTMLSAIINPIIKERAGATVTSGEMVRIATEFADGQYNTEAEKINALAQYKKALRQAMKEHESGYSDKVNEMYSGRGGRTSRSGMELKNYEPDVVAYAKQHGITPAQAQQIKLQRTGG